MSTQAPELSTILAEAARLRRASQLRQAAAAYRHALELEPDNAQILHTLGLLARQVGRDDAALPLLRRAAAARADDAGCHYDLGELYFARGKLRPDGVVQVALQGHAQPVSIFLMTISR